VNFDLTEEQHLLQAAIAQLLQNELPVSRLREIFESETGHDPAFWKSLAAMGLGGLVIPEEYGGAGFGYLELSMIAMEVGRALAPIPFGPSVYFATEAILRARQYPGGGTRWLTAAEFARWGAGEVARSMLESP